MARRNLRAGSRQHVPIVVAIALGVGAVVAVGSATDHARRAVAREAKSLLAADVEIRSTRPASPSTQAAVEGLVGAGANVTLVTELIAMAATPRQSMLVELRAVEDAYPFYGEVQTAPQRPLRESLAGGPPYGAVVQEAVLIRLGLSIGDRFRIGDAEFTVAAVLKAASDHAIGAFSLGPRVLVSRDALDHTGLIRPGSRVRYRTLLALGPDGQPADAVRDTLQSELRDEPVQIVAFTDAQPQLRRSLERLGVYLGLVGVTALLLGGIGVAGSARALLAERWRTLALLKCVGADSRTVVWTTLTELAVLGVTGGVLGVVLGGIGQRLLITIAGSFSAVALHAPLRVWPYLQGVTVGALAGVAFSMWPLMSAAGAPAAAVLRHEAVPLRVRPRTAWWMVAAGAAGVGMLSWWQVDSPRAAALYLGGLGVAATVLTASGWLLARAARAVRPPRTFAWRRGLRALARPGVHTAAAVLSIGLGVTAVLTVGLVERAIHAELTGQIPQNAPSMFFIDIQPDQRDVFATLAAERAVPLDLVPVARLRLHTINGQPVGSEGPPGTDPRHRWYFTREYVVTTGSELPQGNQIIKGQWWDATPGAVGAGAMVSVEQEAADHLGIAVGSTVVFDLQGIPLEARVTSLRSVDWDTRSLNFYMIFSPGALDGAPITYVGAAHVPAAEEIGLQQAVVNAFPNVTAIPISDVLAAAERVVRRVGSAARSVALLVAVVGFAVLGGALAASRETRLREAMLLKTLGATRGAIVRALAVEFGLLGVAAGLIGATLACALAWVISRWLLDMPWIWAPGYVLVAVAATAAATIGVGLTSTYRLLGRRPFPVLRGE